VRYRNSVFHDVLKHVPWGVFAGLVSEHKTDKHVRRLSTKNQFIALLYGQASGTTSFREIVGGLESRAARPWQMPMRCGRTPDSATCFPPWPGRSSAGYAGKWGRRRTWLILHVSAGLGIKPDTRGSGPAMTARQGETSVSHEGQEPGNDSDWPRF